MKILRGIRKNAVGAIAPTIVAALIFHVTYLLFGIENNLMAPFVTLSYLRLRQMNYHMGCMLKHVLIYIVMAVVGYIAVTGPVACAVVNAAALFWVGYLLIDEYNPNNYMSAGMALGLFQVSPVDTLPGLGRRILAILVAFAIIAAFALLERLWHGKKRPIIESVSEGFQICETLIAGAEAGADPNAPETAELHRRMNEVNHALSQEIYSSNRAAVRRRNPVNWFCQFIVVFQVIDYLTANYRAAPEYAADARRLLTSYRRKFDTSGPGPEYLRLHLRDNRPDLRSFRLRFALRLMIVVTPCLVFRYMGGFPNSYWLVISVLTMMMPFSNETQERVKERVIGSFCGLVLCFGLFSLVTSTAGHLVIMAIANFFVYSAGSYGAMVAFITCSAMATQTLDVLLLPTLLQRMAYTFAGALIALLANRFIFPVRAGKQIEYLRELLRDIRVALPKAETRREKDQMIVKSYMITNRIKALNESLPEGERVGDLAEAEREHVVFMADYLLNAGMAAEAKESGWTAME